MYKWVDIWNKDRQVKDENLSTLQKLIYADGFDAATGTLTENDWIDYCEILSKKVSIGENDSLFDVGCGSGAFLYPFYKKGLKIAGLDYSKTLIKIAKEVMPNADFTNDEAINLDEKEKYDFVSSNGVFFYFKDLTYAKTVLVKMISKAKKGVLVLDATDLDKKEESENYRRGAIGKEEYEQKYAGLGHLYYDKQWFYDIAEENNCKCEIHQQFIKNYGNAKYRYNVILKK